MRLLIAALVVVVALGLLLTLVYATDAALSIVERLERLPIWLGVLSAAIVSAIVISTGWLLWRLLRPSRRIARPLPRNIERSAIEQRLATLGEAVASPLAPELRELDRRRESGLLHIALFGAVSAGKSQLVRALLPGSDVAVDVRAGTTSTVRLLQGQLDADTTLVLADVPGTDEWQGGGRALLAREEALRAHLVVYVCDGDLNASQYAEWQWLRSFDKPLLLVLNKIDRYSADELDLLSSTLHKRCGIEPVRISAGGNESVLLQLDDGRVQPGERERAPRIEALRKLLLRHARRGPAALEAARERAVLLALDLKLGVAEQQQREVQAARLVRDYAGKAAIGALAAVAPGSDLVIQGVLASRLLTELSQLYGVSLRSIDLDDFITLAGGRLRGSSALILAITGNALKAFPGLGTVSGGLVHAAAYAMIFDSLGRAVAESLARGQGFDRQDVLQRLEQTLDDRDSLLERAPDLLKLVLDRRSRASKNEDAQS